MLETFNYTDELTSRFYRIKTKYSKKNHEPRYNYCKITRVKLYGGNGSRWSKRYSFYKKRLIFFPRKSKFPFRFKIRLWPVRRMRRWTFRHLTFNPATGEDETGSSTRVDHAVRPCCLYDGFGLSFTVLWCPRRVHVRGATYVMSMRRRSQHVRGVPDHVLTETKWRRRRRRQSRCRDDSVRAGVVGGRAGGRAGERLRRTRTLTRNTKRRRRRQRQRSVFKRSTRLYHNTARR